MPMVLYFILAILPVLLFVAVGILPHVLRRKCPQCGKMKVRWCTTVKGLGFVDGRSVPTRRAYYVCEECNAAFKSFNKGALEELSPDERYQHIDNLGRTTRKAKSKKR